MRRSLRSVISFTAATAVGAAMLVGPVAGRAVATTTDQAAADDLRTALTGTGGVAQFLDGLAPVGSFADAAPGLTVVPGTSVALGLGDLVDRAIAEAPSGYAAATSPADLASALDGADYDITSDPGPDPMHPLAKRHVRWTASASSAGGTVSVLDLTLTATRTVPSGLVVNATTQPFHFSTSSGLSATLTDTTHLVVDVDTSDGSAWVDPSGFSVATDISASPHDLDQADAAIGILGVALDPTSSYDDTVHLATSFRDPNNDGTLTLGTAGELGAKGASSGLSTVAPGKPGGSLSGALVIAPKPSSAVPNLPGVNATVTVGDSDWSANPDPTATVTSGDLSPVRAFETLSSFDLAQGVAQLSATVRELQNAQPTTGTPVTVDLPFLKGTVADLVPASEALDEFLREHIVASTDPKKNGRPDFASFQKMFDELEATTGPIDPATHTKTSVYTVKVEFASFDDSDPDHPKLPFTIHVTRDGTDQPADPAADLYTGGPGSVSYDATSITDTDASPAWLRLTGDNLLAFEHSLAGRQVTVGDSTAQILSATFTAPKKLVIDLDPAPLQTDPPTTLSTYWKGGTPAAGPYVVAGGDPQTGLVQLADLLEAKSGLRNANALRPQATLTPSYDVHLPVVLDLSPAAGPGHCVDAGAPQECPFQTSTGDGGPTTVVDEWPIRSDRFELTTGSSTPLLTGSAVLDTTVDLTAPVGFVPVTIGGEIKVCPTTGYDTNCAPDGGTPGNVVSISTKTPLGMPATLPLGTVFNEVRDHPDDVLTGSESGHAHGALTFSVVDDPSYFGSAPGTTTIDADVAPTQNVTVADGDLPALKVLDVHPGNDNALFGVLLADLGELDDTLHTPATAHHLDTPLPLLGTSAGALMAAQDTSYDAGTTYASRTPTGSTSPQLEVTDPGRTFGPIDVGRRVTIGGFQAPIVALDASDPHTFYLPSVPSTVPATGTPYSLADGLQQSVDVFTAAPPSDLADLLTKLEAYLSARSDTASVSFTADPATKVMTLTLDWTHHASVRSPLNLHVKLSTGDAQIVGDAAKGAVPIDATNHTSVVLHIPLTNVDNPAGALRIDPATSSRTVEAKVTAGGGYAVSVSSLQVKLDPGDLKADTGVTAESGAGADQTLSAWLDGLAPTGLNHGLPAVQCNGGSDASICASLPINSSDGSTGLGTLTVTMPTGNTGDASYAADLDPTTGGRTGDLSALDSAIKSSGFDLAPFGTAFSSYVDAASGGLGLATAGGRFPLVGKDLQQGKDFLGALHDALTGGFTATDLSTFGDIRSAIHTALTSGALNDYFQGPEQVDASCSISVSPPGKPTTTLGSGDVSKAAATATYSYKVFGVLADGQATAFSQPSDPVTEAKPLDASKNYTITLSWSGSNHFDHYVVYRQIDSGGFQLLARVNGGGAKSYTDPGPTVTSAESPGSGNVTYSGPCNNDDPATAIDSVTLGASFGQGPLDPTKGCDASTNKCLHASVPLDLGLPGLSLRAYTDETTGTQSQDVTADLAWKLHISATLDKHKGLLLELTKDGGNHLQVGASLSVPDTMQADLAFLKVNLTRDKASTGPVLQGVFNLDLKCPTASCAKGQVPLQSLADGNPADALNPSVKASLDVDEHIDTGIDPSLPGISTEFKLTGSWNNAGDLLDPSHITALEFDHVTIDAGTMLKKTVYPIIRDVSNALKPVQPILDTISAPIPVLSDLSHAAGGGDVTLLTLAKAFGTGDSDVSTVATVTATLKKLVDLANTLQNIAAGGGIDLGSFRFVTSKATKTTASPDVADSLIGSQTDKDGNPQTDPGSIVKALDDSAASPTTAMEDAGSAGVAFPAFEHPRQLARILFGGDADLVRFSSGVLKIGFSFSEAFGPVYAPPPVMVVISGSANVSLQVQAGFDTVGIRQAVERGNAAQVLNGLFFYTSDPDTGAPLPVVTFHGELAAGAEVSVAFLSAGVEGGIALTVSFTWADPDNDGKFRFDEFVAAAVQNPLCLFNVGGQLSLFIKVFITIGFSPFDVSFDFTLANIKLLDFSVKPNCNPPPPRLAGYRDGVLYLFAGKLGDGYRGDTLWNAGNQDETWVVHEVRNPDTGATSYAVHALGFEQDFPTGDVSKIVLDGRGYGGKLNALFQGYQKTVDGKPVDQPFDATVYVFGGTKDDTIKTADGAAYVDGGDGADTITTGELAHPEDYRSVAVTVAGDGGGDHIATGNGDDTVAGDGHLDGSDLSTSGSPKLTTFGSVPLKNGKPDPQNPYQPDTSVQEPLTASVIDPASVTGLADKTAPAAGAAGRDVIQVGLGTNTVYGGAEDDTVAVAADSPLADVPAYADVRTHLVDGKNTIYGNDGSDTISGGTNDDTIYTGDKPPTGSPYDVLPIQDNPGSADAKGTHDGPVNVVDTGTGNDTVYGSSAVDLVIGHSTPSQHDTIYGLGNDDVLVGGHGTDKIYGGRGDDYLSADPAKPVATQGGVTDQIGTPAWTFQPVPGSATTVSKTLVGGGGQDRIFGGNGPTDIYGDHDRYLEDDLASTAPDPCRSPGPDRSDPPAEHPFDSAHHPSSDSDPSDFDGGDLIVGGSGPDTIQAGGGNDWVYAGGGTNAVCGEGGADHVYGGNAVDTVYGGTGGDVIQGYGDADLLYGNDGPDFIYGNRGADLIEGNADTDTLFGGEGDDTVIGGTTTAARPDAGDHLYGDTGRDVLVGDNGTPDGAGGATLFDLSGAVSGFGGRDYIYGGDDADRAYGGLDRDHIWGGRGNDHLEGNNDSDTIYGEDGADDIIGGSSQLPSGSPTDQDVSGFPDAGDTIYGGNGDDVVTGDNAQITDVAPGDTDPVLTGRDMSVGRHVVRYDLGDTPLDGTSGGDYVEGDDGTDAILAQGGNDRVVGGNGDDYVEGGPGSDWIQGDSGDDDLVGGSSTIDGTDPGGDTAQGQPDAGDVVFGGTGDDLLTGDNAVITRSGTPSPYLDRVGSTGFFDTPRSLRLLDLKWSNGYLGAPTRAVAGGDQLSGGDGVDVVFGQDGNDRISGGAGDDYAEGNGGHDTVYGDRTLADAGITPAHPTPDWPTGAVMSDPTDTASPYGQDDLIGGSSIQAFRDTGDDVHGDGGADFILGDNGTAVRDIVDQAGRPVTSSTDLSTVDLPLTDRVYAKRYDPDHTPVWAAFVRHGVVSGSSTASTRFCTTAQATCEPTGAYGGDNLWGDGGPDTMYGQDGNDHMYGDTGATGNADDGAFDDHTQADDDDMYGGLGNDVMFGEAGEDAMLGDRGGIVDVWQDGSNTFTVDDNQVPQIHYVGFRAGSVTRQVDLRHDVQGDAFLGSSTAAAMPHPGDVEGGDDRMRGGTGHDAIHGGAGDDLANGDSGGDIVFGDDGADVLWGGKGCDQAVDTPTTSPDCYSNGVFDPAARGSGDRMVDYLNGGKGATTGPSVDPDTGDLGADVVDWHPRGSYSNPGSSQTCTDNPWPQTSGTGTVDPCSWFVMTSLDDTDTANNQHHQGIDWMYGGWDRDVLQGDVADNGPNPGDRLLDWTGAYNLYTHCNAAYGGFNDVRQWSPAMQEFLQQWAWSLGAGVASSDVTTGGTSAHDELALVHQSDLSTHGAGSDFPATPGHFDDPNACAP